jgi:hypothetical protein
MHSNDANKKIDCLFSCSCPAFLPEPDIKEYGCHFGDACPTIPERIGALELNAFRNPVTESLIVKVENIYDPSGLSLRILDHEGLLMYDHGRIGDHRIELDSEVLHLRRGRYYVQLLLHDRPVILQQVLII